MLIPRVFAVFLAAAAVLPFVQGHSNHHQDQQQSKALTVSEANLAGQVPSCAINCLSVCPGGDATCICHDDSLRTETAICVQASCIFSDILKTQNYTQTACGAPVRDKTVHFKVLNLVLGLITVGFIGVRAFSKWGYGHRYGMAPEDWIISVISIIGVPCVVLNIVGLADHGLGKDVWTLHAHKVTVFMRYFLAMEMFYVIMMMLIKVNLCIFYRDLFPSIIFRRLIQATMLFHVVFCFAFVGQSFFQCLPLKFFWTQLSDKPGHGQCVDLNAVAWANAGINVVSDIWLIAIPVFQVRKLDLHWKKKVGAAIMFMTGFFVTLVSIIRLSTLNKFGAKSMNPTWDQYDIVWWSTVEVSVGVICTCLPGCRLVLSKMFPRVFDSGLIPGHSKTSKVPPRPRRTEQEDIELCSNNGDFTETETEEAKSTTKTSQTSVSIRTHGSGEVPRTVLSTDRLGGGPSAKNGMIWE